MEEVWKDINLATLNDQNNHGRPTTTHANYGGVILQDFLARPLTLDPPNTMLSSESASLFCPASPAPPLVTALSLSSRPHLYFDHLAHKPHHPPSTLSSFTNPLASSTTATKRFPQPPAPDCSNLGERRNKRMIKNRESAARSRARKQAYTNELELEVEHLKEENARLRRQQQQLSQAVASQQKKKGTTLYRASTAPF